MCARRAPPSPTYRALIPATVRRRFTAQHAPPPKPAIPFQCWSCKVSPLTLRDAFFCGSCGTVQPESGEVDCFKKIGLYAVLELDTRFKAMQRKLHPDYFHAKPKREQELSGELSKGVNRCYRTLRDPNLRGLYMLRLKGFEIKDAERVTDVEFLQGMMEIHEVLAERPESSVLAQLRATNDEQLQKYYTKISEAFRTEKYADARDLLIKVQYLERLADEMHQQTPVK